MDCINRSPRCIESAYVDEAKKQTILFYVTSGFVAELTLGPIIVAQFGFDMWVFAQNFAVPFNFGCFLAASPITIPYIPVVYLSLVIRR
jgi:hypothetical protein